MAKPQNNFQQNHGGRNRQQQRQLESKRARNHSPQIERKREENAWHSNPLAPIPNKVLRKQAQHMIGQFYKPSFEQLSNEEKRVKSISERRKADNSYYLNWLTKQSELLNAHDEAARAQINAAGQQVQKEVQDGWSAVSPSVQGAVEAQPGVSTSAAQTGGESLLSAAAAKGASDIGNARTSNLTQQAIQDATAAGPELNFAQIAAMEGRRQSDLNENLTGIRNARQELRGSRGAEAAKFYQQALGQELEKAQSRAQIAASEATAAIEAKRFGLDANKAKLEAGEFEFEKNYKNRKLGLEGKELGLKEQETKIHRELEEGKISNEQAKVRIEKAKLKNESKKVANEGQRTPAEKAKVKEKQREKNQAINGQIDGANTHIKTSGQLRKLIKQNPQKAAETLSKKYGTNIIAAKAAIELYLNHELSQATKSALENQGYNGRYV